MNDTSDEVSSSFLRRNWPMLAAGSVLSVAIVYLLAQAPLYSSGFEGTSIIYPLIVWTNKTALLFLIISILALVLLVIKGQRRPTAYWLFMSLMVFGLGAAFIIGFWTKHLLLTAIILLVAIVFNIFPYLGDQQASRATFIQIAGVMFMANAFACYGCFLSGIRGLEHQETVQYKFHSYQLAVVRSLLTEFSTDQFVVFECDSTGWLCRSVYSDLDYQVREAKMVVDEATDGLMLQLGDEQILIAD